MKESKVILPYRFPDLSNADYAKAIAELSSYLQKIEMQKYVGTSHIQTLYNSNSPPGTKKLFIENKQDDKALIIDQRIGTFARLISHAIATLHYLDTNQSLSNTLNDKPKKQVLEVLLAQGEKIFGITDEETKTNKNAIIVLQNFLTEGHKNLAKIAGIEPKALLQVDDISTFIRPVVENTHFQDSRVMVTQRFEPISHMSDEQKACWRDIARGDSNSPSWWKALTLHHQARYKQYAQDAIIFETLTLNQKTNIKEHLSQHIDLPQALQGLSAERRYTICQQLAEAKTDTMLDAYLTQLLNGDPWFMLAMPKSSGNRYTPLASNHVRIITTTTDNNGRVLSNTTHVRSNEVIIKSDTFKDYPFDYTTLKSSPALQYESRFSIFMNALLMLAVIPLRIIAALIIDSVTLVKSVMSSKPSTGRYATALLFNYFTTPNTERKTQQEALVDTTVETVKQVYDEFIDDTDKGYDSQYRSFLAHHGIEAKEKITVNKITFTPILHSASLLSPLPDWIENSVDIGSRFFKSDDNKKMLLYKLAAIEKVNTSNDLMGGAKIRAINFAANDYRRLGISGFGNRIHQHNSHVSTELLQDVLKNTLVTLVHIDNQDSAKQALHIHNSLDEKCKIGDRYDLNRLSETDIQQLSTELDSMIRNISADTDTPDKAKHNLSLTLQSVKAYIQLYKKSTENIPENEQILLASYANMMVNGICGPAGRVETHCKSGRDRTFVVQIYEQAMQAYFTQYGKLPLPHDTQDNRKNFVKIYTGLFMQGLAQENSNQNQHGSFGLNNILIQRQRPLCFLAGTADPKSTALLPADILDAIKEANDNIAAQNEGQRYNGKHIKPKKIVPSIWDNTLNTLQEFGKIAIEIALSPLFAMCVLSSKLFPSVNPVLGGLMGAALLATGITLAIVFSPVVLPLAVTPIVIASSLLALSCLHTLVITNPNNKENAIFTQPLIIPIVLVGAMIGLSTLLAPGLALALIPALVAVILPACTMVSETLRASKNPEEHNPQAALAMKNRLSGDEKPRKDTATDTEYRANSNDFNTSDMHRSSSDSSLSSQASNDSAEPLLSTNNTKQ